MGWQHCITSVFALFVTHTKEKENSIHIFGVSEPPGVCATGGLQAWSDRKRTGFARHVVEFNYKCNRVMFTHESCWTASSRRHFFVFGFILSHGR